jgi:ribosomal protein S18 acetylase RimI-like enzyme
MKVKFLKLAIKDLDEFFKVFEEVIHEGFPYYSKNLQDYFIKKDYSKKVFAKNLKEKKRVIFIALVRGGIVGFLVANKPYGGVSFAPWLGVKKESQGKGIGRRLMSYWEKWAKRKGAHSLLLSTSGKQTKNFYIKCGFKFFGTEKRTYFGLDHHVFGKLISKPNEREILRR